MWNPDFGWGFGHGLMAVFGTVIATFAWILCFSVLVAVLFLLVRFLLVATRAAQLYIDRHEPRPAAPVAPASPSAPAPESAPRTSTMRSAPPKPAPKAPPRSPATAKAAPKKPPAS